MEPTARRTTWRDIEPHVDFDDPVLDAAGLVWRKRRGSRSFDTLLAAEGDSTRTWIPRDDEPAFLPAAPLPEPPDGTRMEFEHGTDLYAAARDDASSARAGYTAGDGGDVWCLYGETVPMPWAAMYLRFGEPLALAVRLVPHPDDLAKREQWPTEVWAREQAAKEAGDGQR